MGDRRDSSQRQRGKRRRSGVRRQGPRLLLAIGIVAPALPGFADALPGRTPDAVACEAPDRAVVGALDVAIAIDTSRSTADPSGSDVNANGRVGARVASRETDPGDSLLAAQIAAVRSLLGASAGLDVRFAIVTFSGSYQPTPPRRLKHIVLDSEARIRSGLTRDLEALERVLGEVLARQSNGYTSFSAGMKRSIQTLTADAAATRAARRRVLFISDSPTPLGIRGNENVDRFDLRMQDAAYAALGAGISFSTFAIGPAARSEPPHALSRIAGATGGRFHQASDPTALACQLITSLAP